MDIAKRYGLMRRPIAAGYTRILNQYLPWSQYSTSDASDSTVVMVVTALGAAGARQKFVRFAWTL